MERVEVNVLIIWTGVPSYMVACWRELASEPGVKVKLFLEINRGDSSGLQEILQGLDYTFTFKGEAVQQQVVRKSINDFGPDIMLIVGWRANISRFVTTCPKFNNIPKLLAYDMIFEWKLKKFIAPIVLRSYLKRFVGAFVPGDRTAFYSKFLGFNSSKIYQGLFSIDTDKFEEAVERRSRLKEYPRSFAFVGRYAKEKRLDVLIAAYELYRSKVDNPWVLNCYGDGPEKACLKGVEGVTDCGYTMPEAMVDVYASNGAFVLASEYDPWPLVIAESVASGLPIVCTEACGSHADLVRSSYNGMVCGTNDPESIARGLFWIHENEVRLSEIGRQGIALVKPYSKEQWVDRFLQVCKQLAMCSV